MNSLKNRRTGWLVILPLFFLFSVSTPLLSEELPAKEGSFTVYGMIQSVSISEKRVTLAGGEVIYLTERTSIKNLAGNNVSFPQWFQPGKMIGAVVEEVHGKWMAISVRESGPG